MNRLQLATLLKWAGDGGIQGRKRLQKIVFFLQAAGCPLDCAFTLHHFGPYSRDVADACDEMVAAQLIDECIEPQSGITQYTYTLKPSTRNLLSQTVPAFDDMKEFQTLGFSLLKENIWPLELGSTILFYFRHSNDWDVAMKKACAFKKATPTDASSAAAFELAKRVAGQRRG